MDFFSSKIEWKEIFWKVPKSYSFLQHKGMVFALFFKGSYLYGIVYLWIYWLLIYCLAGLADLKVIDTKYL